MTKRFAHAKLIHWKTDAIDCKLLRTLNKQHRKLKQFKKFLIRENQLHMLYYSAIYKRLPINSAKR